MLTTEKKVGYYQEHKYGLYGPWKSVDYYKISAVSKSKQTIFKSPLPVTFSTLSQFSDFDLRWYSEKKVGHYQEHKCGLYGPWKSADYEQLILDPYEYHFPGAGYLLAMLYCSLHLQRAAEKSTTQTRQEHQSTGNILTRYLENTDFPYIWTKYWLGLVWFFRLWFFKLSIFPVLLSIGYFVLLSAFTKCYWKIYTSEAAATPKYR